ncbi:MAG: hypothetical protein GWO02_01300 [Gammaproteobacteria bacterium]|nr:hypothetical protein [Gammaproteobacteria bacterium]
MQSHSQMRVVDGARVEIGTFVHEGQPFAALGSVVDERRGLLVGYVVRRGGAWRLTTWDGAQIMPLRRTSAYRGLRGAWVHCWTGTLNGRRYSGRNGGASLACTLRARKA